MDENGKLLMPPPLEPVAHRCHGCADRERFRDSIPPDQKGVYVVFQPYEEVPGVENADQ